MEHEPRNESLDDLVREIYKIKGEMNEKRRWDLSDSIVDFDTALKKDLKDAYGNTSLIQQVKPWQALIGGSLEERSDITEEQHIFVVSRVKEFAKELKQKLKED